MRRAITGIGLILVTTPVFAQSLPCAPPADAYDPYKPSHLAVIREYGGTVLSQLPLSSLLKLDPYVPSEAELLRSVGRGIPIWTAYPWYSYPPAPRLAECPPAPRPIPESTTASAPPLTSFADVVTALDRERAATPGAVGRPGAPGAAMQRITGISIQYAGRTWISAGGAVPFRGTEFERIGDSAGFTIYQRVGAKDRVIFVPTTSGMVAPFRAARLR